jgi:mannose-6-phosphate isomerase-like protein (cupin superfamily)
MLEATVAARSSRGSVLTRKVINEFEDLATSSNETFNKANRSDFATLLNLSQATGLPIAYFFPRPWPDTAVISLNPRECRRRDPVRLRGELGMQAHPMPHPDYAMFANCSMDVYLCEISPSKAQRACEMHVDVNPREEFFMILKDGGALTLQIEIPRALEVNLTKPGYYLYVPPGHVCRIKNWSGVRFLYVGANA